MSQLYSLVENFQSEHRKLKESRNASVGLFWREKRERKNARKNNATMREREREMICVFVVSRVIQKNHHTYVPQQMKVRRNWTRGIFFSSPSFFKPKTLTSYNTKKFFLETKTQQTPTRDDDARRRARLRLLAHTQHLRETKECHHRWGPNPRVPRSIPSRFSGQR